MNTKICGKCGLDKPLAEFWKHAQWGYQSYCKTCKKQHREEHLEKSREYGRNFNYRKGTCVPLGTNQECASYLGVYIAERVLSVFFENIVRTPFGNPGYDFICKNGFMIDAKSATLRPTEYNSIWQFRINHNTIADYFLCVGFDDRANLNPLHVWLIPGRIINDRMSIGIMNSAIGLRRFAKYEQPIDKVIACCETLREHGECEMGPQSIC
jgi:hypothetical protein